MRRSKFSEEQILAIVKEGEAGRKVADLLPNARHHRADVYTHHVFVRDLLTATTHLVSRTSDGQTANGSSRAPAINADGRFVAYASWATNVVSRDRNHSADICLDDTWTSRTMLVSHNLAGASASGARRSSRDLG